ncbi:MAG: matrixin family metalloprotease [Dehalococcoidia bacterium]
MTRLPAAARSPRLASLTILALGLALVAGIALHAPRGTSAAGMAPPTVVVAAETGDAYELNGFRWTRTSIPVYYNWGGGACAFSGYDFSGPTTTIAQSVLLDTLRASIAEINTQLRGGLTLNLAGPASRGQLCSTSSTLPIVIGFGTLTSTGEAISFASGSQGEYSTYTAARVFLTNRNAFSCTAAPVYRDLQHTMTHELLHAIGLGHSTIPSALMAPTFVACQAEYVMQPDDIEAIAALYPPTLPAPGSTPSPTSTAAFATAVRFSPSGQALAVFGGGSLSQLEAAARSASAAGVWVQDPGGAFRLLVVDGPPFLRAQFAAAFPATLPANLPVTLVR